MLSYKSVYRLCNKCNSAKSFDRQKGYCKNCDYTNSYLESKDYCEVIKLADGLYIEIDEKMIKYSHCKMCKREC